MILVLKWFCREFFQQHIILLLTFIFIFCEPSCCNLPLNSLSGLSIPPVNISWLCFPSVVFSSSLAYPCFSCYSFCSSAVSSHLPCSLLFLHHLLPFPSSPFPYPPTPLLLPLLLFLPPFLPFFLRTAGNLRMNLSMYIQGSHCYI